MTAVADDEKSEQREEKGPSEGEGEGGATSEQTGKSGPGGDEDDNETMEVIELPDRTKAGNDEEKKNEESTEVMDAKESDI